jgi:glucose/arabinose dehydrogenase
LPALIARRRRPGRAARKLTWLALAALIVFPALRLTAPAAARPGDWPQLALAPFAGGLSLPDYLTSGDASGRLFVLEQAGRVRIIEHGALLPTPFLDVSARVLCCGERGLLGIAFPPGDATARRFYLDYNNLAGDTVIARYAVTADPDLADPDSEQVVLRIAQPYPNHKGGQLAFGPDGFLYVGMGDGGLAFDPGNRSQNPAELLGKILRIDVETGAPATYTVPPSNPFVGRAGSRPEVWALGLRNPWRFSFDRQTNDLYIADVGQNEREEIDFQPAASSGGENYGWRIFEGTLCTGLDPCNTAGLTFPVVEYDHSREDCAVIGGYVYRGAAYPALGGVYLYGDFCTGRIWGLRRQDGSWATQELLTTGFSLSSFGEDRAGELYALRWQGAGAGAVYRLIVPGACPSAGTPQPTGTPLAARLFLPLLAGGTCAS